MKILAVGDIHFHKDAKIAGDELIERIIEIYSETKPNLVVLLGDVLDTHETVKNVPWKQAERLFKELSKTPLYVLIGNHDLCSATEYLTDNHFFNPYKLWPNITIVDHPIKIAGNIVMCPYVPPGRFIEALNVLYDNSQPYDWREASLIFAHQWFDGAIYEGGKGEADKWSSDLPTIISGHIHDECQVGDNVYYTGSSRQVKFNELPDKKVWLINLSKKGMEFEKIELGLKSKIEMEMNYEDVKKFDFEMCKSYYIKLKLKGSPEQFKLFRKHPLYTKLAREGVKVHFINVEERSSLSSIVVSDLGQGITFEGALKEIIKNKRESIQKAYEELYSK